MNFEYYIAQRIKTGKIQRLSKPIVKISFISIALGLALMIISVAVVIGFKNSVSEKVMGVASHIQLVLFDNDPSLQGNPVTVTDDVMSQLLVNNKIAYIQFTAQKAGVIKTNDQIQGVVLKGVDSKYNSKFIIDNLIAGSYPDIGDSIKTDEVMISESIAKKLNIQVGDNLRMWFVDEDDARARGRKFSVVGIYNTGVEEFDNMYMIGDLRHIQKLNNWNSDEVGSIEIYLNDVDEIANTASELYNIIPYNITVETVYDTYPQIFNWLDLLDMNVIVILALMILVATITMVSTLLVLIIERTSMVGLLKALGSNNRSIRKIFLYKASGIILTGMLWGNIIGLAFYFIQLKYRLISLAPESYYVDYVPVELHLSDFILLNLGTFIVSVLVLIIPSYYITRIIPARALRYE